MRQLKKAELERHVRAIHDGGKALAYLSNPRFKCEDLAAIFLDLKLPTLSGLQILEKIRASDRLRHLSVVIMTSSNSPEELEHCRQLGVFSFVQKPLTFSSFAKAFADSFHARRTMVAPNADNSIVD